MNIPTLLAGPIVRRVEPTQVLIWVVMSKRYVIGAEFYSILPNNHSFEYKQLKIISQQKTVQLGKKLFINLIKISPHKRTLPCNTLLGYNLRFSDKSRDLDLGSFGLLSTENPHRITYGELKYPSFFIGNGTTDTNIIYGSCRKFHGIENDALTSGDFLIEENYSDVENRPSSLFLTGDQIYADDVADPLFPFMYELGKELTGRQEEDLSEIDARLALEPFQTSINQMHGRQFIIEHFCKFTTQKGHNHMIRFGEFAAMYLIGWSPELWEGAENEGLFDPFEKKVGDGKVYFVHPNKPPFKKDHNKEREQYEFRYIEQLKQLYECKQTIAYVRRLLANIPTYMVFDDHDITDDWNLSIDWKQDVRNAPLGKHIVANGLAAYWAFQGWGNDPDTFHDRFCNKMEQYFHSTSFHLPIYEEWTNELWDFDQWQFVAPTYPKAAFLDTRTMRSYDPTPIPVRIGNIIDENIRSPQLISFDGLKQLSNKLFAHGWKEGNPLLLVSPTPVYGIDLIERVLEKYVYPLRVFGIPVHSLLDFEAWKYNETGFDGFRHWVSQLNPSNCMILSGDVHYGFTVKSSIIFPNGKKMRFFQFTSSPLRNMSFSGRLGALLKQILRIYSKKRKKESIHRFSDNYTNIYTEKEDCPCPDKYRWKECIDYVPLRNGSIIETQNNLGFLRLTQQEISHTLLKYHGLHLQKEEFDKIYLFKK